MLRRNVLIFHQAALGDFVVTWPLAMALSRMLPQNRIVYVTHAQKGALAERVLRVESADSEAGWHLLHLPAPEVLRLPEKPAKRLDGAAMAVSFYGGATDALADGMSRAAPHAKVISLKTTLLTAGHVTGGLVEQLRQIQPPLATAMEQMLRSIESRGVGYATAPDGRIVVHPGAGKSANRWPAEHFLELVRRLRDGGKRVRVLLGEAEIEQFDRSTVEAFSGLADVVSPPTLLDLLGELASADAFVGNDSGPAHLAGIIGIRTIALFGRNSDPLRWRPLGPKVCVLSAESLEAIPPATVYTELLA
jgi:ADP-heptose:LPS heptosyltransferase